MKLPLLILALGALLALVGCGNGLTGGSVPIGEVDGWVYRSTRALASTGTQSMEPPQQVEGMAVLGQIPVELALDSGRVLTAKTDDTGYFIFHNVPKGHFIIRAGNATSDFAQMEVDFNRQDDRARVQLTMAPRLQQGMDAPKQLTVTPAAVTGAHVGDIIVFTAGVTGLLGSTIDVPVSWAVRGDIGTIGLQADPLLRTSRGVFHATKAGTGAVLMQYRDMPPQVVPVTVLPQEAP
jgi:hypothetical protein